MICSCNFVGTYVASELISEFCVEKFGTERMQELKREEVQERLKKFKALTHFEIEL